jgi:Arc/MetJ family transcription regulator
MKTTVVIEDKLLRAAMKATGAKTKKEVIEIGLREVIKKKNIENLRKELGTYDLTIDLKELRRLRSRYK